MAVDYEPTPLPECEDAVSDGEAPRQRVHPAAAVFPMLPPDELAALAADIAEHGLREPIMLDAAGVLIDGRNRLAACELAEVEPTFATLLAGEDPVAYILSRNVHRRHMTAGARAMAVVKAECVSSGNTTMRAAATLANISAPGIAKAETVRNYAPELVDGVIGGAVPLNEAYQTARERKLGATSVEGRLARLQAAAPDLAVLVTEERLTLVGAEAELREREAEVARHRSITTRALLDAILFLDPGDMPDVEWLAGAARAWTPALFPSTPITAASAGRAAANLARFAAHLAQQEAPHE